MDLASRSEFVVEDSAASKTIGRVLNNFALPLGLGAIALIVAGRIALPAFLSGLKIHGPYLVLFGGLLLSLAFRRGRAFFVLFSLTLAYFAYIFFIQHEPVGFVSQTVSAALCLFVPFNIAMFTVLGERGVLNGPGLRRLSLLLIEVGVTAAVLIYDVREFADVVYRPMVDHVSLSAVHLPQWGIVFTIAAIAIGVSYSVLRGSAIDAAFAGTAAAFAVACSGLPLAGVFVWFCTIAGLIMAFAVMHDSHRMAFYDELTGLPGRRALNERLAALDGSFTLAVVDIDHFKGFNDTWGHEVGDQVLKLVAAQLQRVGGGGTAYRHGGEEFAIVFPGRRGASALERLETLRQKIADYKITLRQRRRLGNSAAGRSTLTTQSDSKWISVRVSIGVAERDGRGEAADRVLQAADVALYRAKSAGRNRVIVE
ncbi:MAG: GGDEF domain-containing protein [Betaproteobacteria bacterium]